MVAIPLSEDEQRVDDLIQGKITVQDFVKALQAKLDQGAREAVYALLPLTQKRSDYWHAVECIGHDPNGALSFDTVIQEKRRHSLYQVKSREFEFEMMAINNDGDDKYDRPAFAIAKHWATMLQQKEEGLKEDIQQVIDFTREHPVAPEVPVGLQNPRRSRAK